MKYLNNNINKKRLPRRSCYICGKRTTHKSKIDFICVGCAMSLEEKLGIPINSKNPAPKILLFDIETTPNLAYVWGKYEQDVIQYKSEWYMLSWSAKWLGGPKIMN